MPDEEHSPVAWDPFRVKVKESELPYEVRKAQWEEENLSPYESAKAEWEREQEERAKRAREKRERGAGQSDGGAGGVRHGKPTDVNALLREASGR
jgi:hypothetical protein